MKIICNTKDLTTAVLNVCRAVSTKTTIPVLEGILIVAKDNSVTLSCYDFEIGIKTSIKATVIQQGEVILNAKLFSEIVKKIPRQELSISTQDDMKVQISSGFTNFSIPFQGVNDYPKIPIFEDDDQISINAAIFKNMIEKTIFAVALNDSKPVHMGSLLECKDGILTLVSVDGIRLALKKVNIDYDKNKSVVIPAKTLSEIPRLISDLDQNIYIRISKKYIIFEIENYLVISRLIEGQFLDYRSSIPQNYSTQVIISPRDFIDYIDRTSIVIFDKLKAPIKLSIESDIMKFYCFAPTGSAYDELPCQIQGSTFEIGFNSKALLEALRVIDEENIKLLFNGPLSPMKIMPLDGDDFIFLVLPVRLKSEAIN